MHDLSERTKQLMDLGSVAFAGMAGALTLANAALIVSIAAGLVSVALGGIRIYDRMRYGRRASS